MGRVEISDHVASHSATKGSSFVVDYGVFVHLSMTSDN